MSLQELSIFFFLSVLCLLAAYGDMNVNEHAFADLTEFQKKDVKSLTDANDQAEDVTLEVKRQSQNAVRTAVDIFCKLHRPTNPSLNALCNYRGSIIEILRAFCKRIGAKREIQSSNDLIEGDELSHQVEKRQTWFGPARELCKEFRLVRRDFENLEYTID